MDRILLAVDGSDHSRRATDLAAELAAGLGAVVDVIHVVPEPSSMPMRGPIHEYARLEHMYLSEREILLSAGESLVNQASLAIRAAGGSVQHEEVGVGSPAERVVSFAEGMGADCIVMGRRGMGNLKGLFMGSVSLKVGQLTDRTLVTVG